MGNDQVKTAAQQVKGSIKEAIGKINGDPKIEAEGAAEKAASDVRSGTGKEDNKSPASTDK